MKITISKIVVVKYVQIGGAIAFGKTIWRVLGKGNFQKIQWSKLPVRGVNTIFLVRTNIISDFGCNLHTKPLSLH